MKIKEFIIIPSSIDAMGLIHKPGKGPNNRFGFKNVGNNKANELEETKEATERQKNEKERQTANSRRKNCCIQRSYA